VLLGGCGRLAEKHLIPLDTIDALREAEQTAEGPGGRRRRGRRRAFPPAQPLAELEERLQSHVKSDHERMLALLKETVSISSGSQDRAGLRKVSERFAQELEQLGFQLEWVEKPTYEIPRWEPRRSGDHLIARRGGPHGPHIVLLGHVDTIFEADSGFTEYREQGDRARGPGVLDMKGGVVVMLGALRALQREGLLDRVRLTVILNADEETGSLTSRAVIEREARGADAALVFEGSASGNLVISRGGLGQFRIRVHGQAVHVANMQRGVNAIQDLAIKIVKLNQLTNIERGITVNVAPVGGGIKRNQVADLAWCEVDLRYSTRAAGEKLRAAIREIATRSYVRSPNGRNATETDFWGILHRPPMPRTAESLALAQYFRETARDLGRACRIVHSRGGSDANITANIGVPTIDGLGPIGGGAHTTSEHLILSSLSERASLAAIGIARLVAAPRRAIAGREKVEATGGGGEK
jgi:glutamate carboxypeptidase